MNVLRPNTGNKIECIVKNQIYIKVTDYKTKFLLKEIKVNLGQHHWEWINLKEGIELDLSELNGRYSTFENSINRAVNDCYATVYVFESFEEMIKNWKKISYIDTIETKYKL